MEVSTKMSFFSYLRITRRCCCCRYHRKFKDIAKIGDHSERALRKQWLNMVQHYRIQKSNMRVTPLNKQCIDVLNKEWEFFGEIHTYMTQRTTDLHSYALKEPNVDQSNNNVSVRTVANDHSFAECSSKPSIARSTKNTTDPASPGCTESPSTPVADKPEAPESGLQQNSDAVITAELSPAYTFTDWDSQESSEPSDPVAVEVSDLSETESIATKPAAADTASKTVTVSDAAPMATTPKRKRKALTEREKYYRHRRRFEHRMEARLGGLCVVAGQLLEHLVPDMNVTPLLMNIYNNVDYTCDSSCDNDDDSDNDTDDEDDNVVGAENGQP